MNKLKETAQILNEWRKFERGEKLNEAASTTRVKYAPTQKAIDLKEELEVTHGKGNFHCYDFFDSHSDDEMLDPDDGLQIELEAIVEHINANMPEDYEIKVSDIVMGGDKHQWGKGNEPQSIETIVLNWSALNSPAKYYYDYITINGRKQPVIYRPLFGGHIDYYLWPGLWHKIDGSKQSADPLDFEGSVWV